VRSSLGLRAVLGEVRSDWRMDLFHLQVCLVKSAHRLLLGQRLLLVYATMSRGIGIRLESRVFSIELESCDFWCYINSKLPELISDFH
jgi:hypothetical protein